MNRRILGYSIDDLKFNADRFFKERTPAFINEASQGVGDSRTNDQLRQLGNSSRMIAVKPGEDIQAAIDKMGAIEGGGTVILRGGTHKVDRVIYGRSGVDIRGEGLADTTVQFVADGACFDFGTLDDPVYFSLEAMFIEGFNSPAAISITRAQNFRLRDIFINDNDGGTGITINGASLFKLENVTAYSNSSHGIELIGEYEISGFTLENCQSLLNEGRGFSFEPGSSGEQFSFSIMNCLAAFNSGDAFYFENNRIEQLSVTNSYGFGSLTGAGFRIGCERALFSTCTANGNATYGYHIGTPGNVFINCPAVGNGTSGYYLGETGDIATTIIESDASPLSGFSEKPGNFIQYDTPRNNRRSYKMTNGSGGTVTAGSVVIYSPSAPSTDFTTTTTAGDARVVGMTLSSVNNAATGPVLKEGLATTLKVNGTTDIAVGDFLSTYTSAGIAAKASSGHTAFAIALEAYTGNDSNGVIDALLISPRYIA